MLQTTLTMQKILCVLLITLIASACDKHSPSPEATVSDVIKPSCEKPKKLLDDIETQSCSYNTNSIQLAYQQIVNEVNARQGKITKLRKELPLKDAEDSFDEDQFWVTFTWKNKTEIIVKVTTEGEESEYAIRQVNDKTEVLRTRALQ